MLLLPMISAGAVDKITLTVLDRETEEPVLDCRVLWTDPSGKEHMTLTTETGVAVVEDYVTEAGYRLVHLSYETLHLSREEILARKGIIRLTPKDTPLQGILVYSKYRQHYRGNEYHYNALESGNTISAIGEPDVLLHILSLPGVAQGVEGTVGLFVRGGNSGSNGLYFDDVPLHVSSHLMGLVSVYPEAMVDEVDFRMGGLPADRADLSSALLDVSPKKDYGSPFSGKVSLSPFLSGAYLSVPLVKDKMSLQVSARTSPAAIGYSFFANKDTRYVLSVYDVTASLNYRPSPNQSVEAFFFTSDDRLGKTGWTQTLTQRWGATIAKLGWQGSFHNGWSVTASGYYDSTLSSQDEEVYYDKDEEGYRAKLGLKSGLKEYALTAKGTYRPTGGRLWLDFGTSWQRRRFSPESKDVTSKTHTNVHNYLTLDNSLIALYGEIGYTPIDILSLQLGYRQIFQVGESDGRTNYDLHGLADLVIGRGIGLELSYDRMTQTYHALEGLPTGWSLSVLIPNQQVFPAEITHQYYGGLYYSRETEDYALKTSLGGYYRSMEGLIMYVNSLDVFDLDADTWEEQVDVGSGRSYGMEISAALKTPHSSTTLAYTLSKTDRQFPRINHGERFPFKFDRRHILNLQSQYTFGKHRTKRGRTLEHLINGVIAFSSGNWVTIPLGYYEGIMPPYWDREGTLSYPPDFYNQIYDRQQMSPKNGYQMEDFFRIDLGYTLRRTGPKTVNEFGLSVYNVLNRHNPYMYFREDGQWKQISILPIVPSIRWSISW